MTGTWMAYALAVSAVAMAAGLGAERALERLGRPTRWVWLAAMLLGVLVPAGALLRAPLPAAPLAAGAALGVGEVVMVGTAAFPDPMVAPRITLDAALLAGWGAVSLLFALSLAWSAVSLERTRRHWKRAKVEGARTWISERTGPAVVGFLRPEIVLPAWVLDWDPALRRLIVAHEREHVRAGDGRLLLAGLLLLCAAPWNLALWWQWRRLKQAVETDCDRRVLATAPDVRRYGTLLLEVAERTKRHALPMAAFAESSSSLERRIRMMTNRQARNRAGWVLAVALSVAAAPAALLALPAPAPVGVEGVRGAVTGWVRAQQPEQVHRVTVPAEQVHDRLLLLMPPDPDAHRDTVPAGQSHAYQARELDVKPRLLNPPEIKALLTHLYPPELQAARVGGTAVVQFVVAVDGTVDPSTIKTISSTDPRFGEASAAAVRAFRFQPGLLNGKKVRALIQMPVTWQPDSGTSAPAVDPADFSGMGVARGVDAGAQPRDSTKFMYEVARLDTKPELLNTREIADLMNRFYPRGLREAGIGGPVVVEFVIQADGSVDPTTLRLIGNPNPQLGTASILVAERFQFRPGMRNGKPVRVLIQMPMTWQPPAGGAEANPKGFQELIPPKEPPPAIPDVDTGAPAVNPADFRVVGEGDTHARITGFILDRNDHPVVGASVSIPALHRGAITQPDGRFAILVPPGTHRLEVSAPGWPKAVSMEVRALAGRTAVVGLSEPAP